MKLFELLILPALITIASARVLPKGLRYNKIRNHSKVAPVQIIGYIEQDDTSHKNSMRKSPSEDTVPVLDEIQLEGDENKFDSDETDFDHDEMPIISLPTVVRKPNKNQSNKIPFGNIKKANLEDYLKKPRPLEETIVTVKDLAMAIERGLGESGIEKSGLDDHLEIEDKGSVHKRLNTDIIENLAQKLSMTKKDDIIKFTSIPDIVYEKKRPSDTFLFNHKGMLFLTQPKHLEERDFNKLIKKVIKFKIDEEKNRFLRKPLTKVFNEEEIGKIYDIVQGLRSDNTVTPKSVYDFNELVL